MHHLSTAESPPEHQNKEQASLALSQKILLVTLLGLLILMVIFFVNSLENRGPDKYQACMEKKCAGKEENLCDFAIKKSCCIPTGGRFSRQNGEYVCSF